MKKKIEEPEQPLRGVSEGEGEKPLEKSSQRVFSVKPTQIISIVAGNQVLFLGKGAHEITLT